MIGANKTPGVLISEIKMRRTTYNETLLLVEGAEDSRFWKAHIRKKKCEVIICNGKENVLQTIGILDSLNMNGALGIVDRDFDGHFGTTYSSQNVLATDTHDLESLILKTPAFDKLLAEVGREDKIEALVAKKNKAVKEILLDLAFEVGKLRLLTIVNQYNLKFKKDTKGGYTFIGYGEFIERKNLDFTLLLMIREVKNFSMNHQLN